MFSTFKSRCWIGGLNCWWSEVQKPSTASEIPPLGSPAFAHANASPERNRLGSKTTGGSEFAVSLRMTVRCCGWLKRWTRMWKNVWYAMCVIPLLLSTLHKHWWMCRKIPWVQTTDTVWIFLLSGTGTTTPTTTPRRIPLNLLLEFTPKCTAP